MVKLGTLAPVTLVLAALSIGAGPTTRDAVPTTRPAAVESAQTVMEDWVGQFRGKTERQILRELGDGGERKTWQSGDQHGLELRYRLGSATKLDLLFSDGRVVYANVTVGSS